MVSVLEISRSLLDRIEQAAQDARPDECCGLLLGQGQQVHEIAPARNVAEDPTRRFEIDPAALIAAYRNSRQGGPEVMGHYHSHPTGPAMPSKCDADMAIADGGIWLILGQDGVTAWRTGDGGLHGRFTAIDLRIG